MSDSRKSVYEKPAVRFRISWFCEGSEYTMLVEAGWLYEPGGNYLFGPALDLDIAERLLREIGWIGDE